MQILGVTVTNLWGAVFFGGSILAIIIVPWFIPEGEG